MIFLTQCLCGEKRHAILAIAHDQEVDGGVELRAIVDKLLELNQIKDACGLCGARSGAWYFETARTAFETIEEAVPFLREIQDPSLATRRARDAWKN